MLSLLAFLANTMGTPYLLAQMVARAYPVPGSTESYGTYSIRKGGCERFDSRSAKELLGYLLDLLDDETHAFHAVSSGFQPVFAAHNQLAKGKDKIAL